jgi:hypothetical protein
MTPLPLEKHHAGGYRYIQRSNGARHRDANQDIAMLFHQLVQTVPLAAHDEDCGLGVFNLAIELAAALV